MSTNLYTPPKADLAEPARPAMAAWKAVLLGYTIDVGGSIFAGVVIGAGYATYLVSTGMNPAQVGPTISSMSPMSALAIFEVLIGSTLSFIGGMVCTRLARRSDYRLGFVLAGLSALSGLLLSFRQHSIAINLLLTLVTFSIVMLGTRFGQVKEKAGP